MSKNESLNLFGPHIHIFMYQLIFRLIFDSEPYTPYYLTMITFLNHNITIC